MANYGRVKMQVFNPGGTFARSIYFNYPKADGVVGANVNSAYKTTYVEMCQDLEEKTGGYFDTIPHETTFLQAEQAPQVANALIGAFHNRITINVAGGVFQGTKFLLNNGSYIIVDSVNTTQYQTEYTTTVTLKYYTKRDVLAYQYVRSQTINTTTTQVDQLTSAFAMPWLTFPNVSYLINSVGIVGRFTESLGITAPTLRGTVSAYISPTTTALGKEFFEGIKELDPDDPYPDDDDSDDDYPDNPDGIPDDDPVPFPDDPDIDVLDSGFITLFAPTKGQVYNLASYMWAGGFDINTFRKIFADPMDCILGFNILPFQVTRGNLASVTVGNISTGVDMYKAGGQWQTIDCGSLNLGKIYDTYLDFAPYTKWSIYLPFIGLQQLSTDDVAHKTLHLKYKIDVLSCSCVAYLMCEDTILYQYSGSCGYAIPITSDNFASMISNIVSIAATGASIIASGGVTAPMAVGASASIANNVMGLKPDIKRGGSIGASAGLMGVQKPYVIIEIPNICKPAMQHRYLGYPSFITKTVRDVEGYSEWETIILDGIPCTDAERAEILEIMKGGLYV